MVTGGNPEAGLIAVGHQELCWFVVKKCPHPLEVGFRENQVCFARKVYLALDSVG